MSKLTEHYHGWYRHWSATQGDIRKNAFGLVSVCAAQEVCPGYKRDLPPVPRTPTIVRSRLLVGNNSSERLSVPPLDGLVYSHPPLA